MGMAGHLLGGAYVLSCRPGEGVVLRQLFLFFPVSRSLHFLLRLTEPQMPSREAAVEIYTPRTSLQWVCLLMPASASDIQAHFCPLKSMVGVDDEWVLEGMEGALS